MLVEMQRRVVTRLEPVKLMGEFVPRLPCLPLGCSEQLHGITVVFEPFRLSSSRWQHGHGHLMHYHLLSFSHFLVSSGLNWIIERACHFPVAQDDLEGFDDSESLKATS